MIRSNRPQVKSRIRFVAIILLRIELVDYRVRFRGHAGNARTCGLGGGTDAVDPQRKSVGAQRSLFRVVGADFKPALFRQIPLARCSLGRPPTAQDYSRCRRECDRALSRCESLLVIAALPSYATRPACSLTRR